VNDHYLGLRRDAPECEPHRVLAPRAAFDDDNRLCTRCEVRRPIRGQFRGERDDDLVYDGRIDEGVEAALEDRPASEGDELLRVIGAEALATSASCDDC
jgi:hypothetical protein